MFWSVIAEQEFLAQLQLPPMCINEEKHSQFKEQLYCLTNAFHLMAFFMVQS